MTRVRLALLVLRALVVVACALVVTVFALPSPIASLSWRPQRAPSLEGPYLMNDVLRQAPVRWHDAVGAEDTAVDSDGRLYSGLADGRIVRLNDDGTVTDIVNTTGRPLGLEFSKTDGGLYVCDADRGLLHVDLTSGRTKVLVDTVEGDFLNFTNDLAIDSQGVIYFTDASMTWGKHHYTEDILDQRPSGRVMRYDPASNTTLVIARDIAFANGVALMPDEQSLLVAETARYRVWRIWLSGDKKNLKEPFIENLPGFPDNLEVSPRGTVWIPMASVRKRLLDAVHPHPYFKDAIAALPNKLRPKPVRWGFVLEVDLNGTPLRSLQDPSGDVVSAVTSARERDGVLYLGTLDQEGVATVALTPALTP